MAQTISVVMIVKNEEAVLEKCLSSVKGLDEIIVCDTGSTDGTIGIAGRFTDKVFTDYSWEDSFCKARNHALSKATGDWILSIDADEHLLVPIDAVRKAVEANPDELALDINMVSPRDSFWFPRLFRRDKRVYWCGDCHNHLSVGAKKRAPEVKIEFSYSPSHAKDPDRSFRILKKSVDGGNGGAREKFYLAREYGYRQDWKAAIGMYLEYLEVAHFPAEMAEANLQMARAYLKLSDLLNAQRSCLEALRINSNFKEAIELMSKITGPGNSKRWRAFASTASNEGVLFVRSLRDRREVLLKDYDRTIIVDTTLEDNDVLARGLLMDGRFYEADVLERARTLNLDAGKAIVDVGANVGNHTMFFSMFCPCSQVYAFEPYGKVLNVLRHNVELNKLDNVTIMPYAMGDKEGLCDLDESPNGWDGSTCVKDGSSVNMVTLDKALEGKQVSLIKVDVEGYEYKVMLGAKGILESQHPYLFIELKTPESKKEMDSYLSGFGYATLGMFHPASPTYLYGYVPKPTMLEDRKEMLKLLPKGCSIAELGVFIGGYSQEIIDALEPSRFYMVDTFSPGKAHSSGVVAADLSEYYGILKKRYEQHHNVHVVKSTTLDFLMSSEPLDAVYIDADHTYKGVKSDLDGSYPKVKAGGYIMGHDYEKPGVKRAVDEFCAEKGLHIDYLTEEESPSFAIRKPEKIVYYCDPGMKIFGENMLKHMGYRKYDQATDIDKPVLFQGLYTQYDYNVFTGHKGRKMVFWNNSDVRNLQRKPDWLAILKRFPDAAHACHNEQLREELEAMGIEAPVKPVFFGDLGKYQVSYKPTDRPHVYLIAHPGREEEYGVGIVSRVASRVPNVTFHIYGLEGKSAGNIIYHGNVDASIAEERLDREIKDYHCCLRMNKHDGVSQTVMKSILMGHYPITHLEMDGVWNAKTDDDVVRQLERLSAQTAPNLEVREEYLRRFDDARNAIDSLFK